MSHECHWTGCRRAVHPRFWGCPGHWAQLPRQLREVILKEYRPGQETDKNPSLRYLAAMILARDWIADKIEIHADGSVHAVPEERQHSRASV